MSSFAYLQSNIESLSIGRFIEVVCTCSHFVISESAEEGLDYSDGIKKTPEELRALWRKAILETLLLIRMERENQVLQGNYNCRLMSPSCITRGGNKIVVSAIE